MTWSLGRSRGEEDQMREITMIDISDFESAYFLEKQSGLLGKAVRATTAP